MVLISSLVNPSSPRVFWMAERVVPDAPLRVIESAVETLRGETILFSRVPSRLLPSNEKLKALLALTNFRDLSFITIFSPATEGTVSFEQPTVKTADKINKRPYFLYFIIIVFNN